MIYIVPPKGEQVEGPDNCTWCNKPLTSQPDYYTIGRHKDYKIKTPLKVCEAFCDGQCSLNWYEARKRDGK